MKRRRIILLSILLVAVLGISAWLMFHPREPVYEGKPLQQWVDEYSAEWLTNRIMLFQSQMGRDRPRRIREFGPSAAPALIRLVETRHPWKQKLYDYLITHDARNRRAIDFVKGWPVESMRPQTAATFLGFIGPDAEPAIPALMRAAVGTNSALGSSAIGALAAIHRQPDLVVPFLIKLIGDTNQSLALSALAAVRWYTERPNLVVPVLIQAITNQNPTKAFTDFRAIYAAQGLPGFGTNALAAIPALRQVATSSPISTAFYAAEALQKIDPDSTVDAVVAVYIRILQDRSYSTPFSAILGLYRLGARARSATPVLVNIASKGGQLSQESAYALKAIDPEAAAKLWPSILNSQMLLANASSQAEPETKEELSARILPMNDQAIPYLITLLKDTNQSGREVQARINAAHLLGEMGPKAEAAVPALQSITNRYTVALAAVMKIRKEPIAPIIERLKDQSYSSDLSITVIILGEFGTNAEPAIPFLIPVMKDPARFYGDAATAASALGEIHCRPDLCLPALIPLLDHPAMPVRNRSLEALAKFGPDAKPAVPKIIESLEDLDYGARVAATNALKRIDPEAAAKAGIK
jgi:HEAT repeat protein